MREDRVLAKSKRVLNMLSDIKCERCRDILLHRFFNKSETLDELEEKARLELKNQHRADTHVDVVIFDDAFMAANHEVPFEDLFTEAVRKELTDAVTNG